MIRTKENAHLFKYQTNKETKKKIDTCLHKISALQAQMIGSDSTQEEIDEYNKLIVPFKQSIREADEAYYNELYPMYINEKELLKSAKKFAKENGLLFDKVTEKISIYVIQECKTIMDSKA